MRYRNYLNGEWTDPSGTQTTENRNPARTGDVIGEVPLSTTADVDRAIEAAQRAQRSHILALPRLEPLDSVRPRRNEFPRCILGGTQQRPPCEEIDGLE